MNVIQKLEPFPHYILENVYDPVSYSNIRRELNMLRNNGAFGAGEETGSARDLDGKMKKKNNGVFLDSFYNPDINLQRRYSKISDVTSKNLESIFDFEKVQMEEHMWYYRSISFGPHNYSTLVSYYENSDHYDAHTDHSTATMLVWVYDEPKVWKGGDVTFTDFDYTVECKNNTGVIFPGPCQHMVHDIQMAERDKGKGLGRYAISTFLSPMFMEMPMQMQPPEENPEQNQ